MSTCQAIVCCEPSPFQTPITSTAVTYWNTEQCATVACPSDPTETATACVAAATFSSTISQAAADALASAQATQNAQALLSCAFTSTQQVCVDCPNTLGVPLGTGTGSVNTGSTLTLDLGSSQTAASYLITVSSDAGAPVTYTLFGSNDALIWVAVDGEVNVPDDNAAHNYFLPLLPTYRYYKLVPTNAPWLWTATLSLYGTSATQICETATQTSLISQDDADKLAYEAALEAALTACAGASTASTLNPTAIVMPADCWGGPAYCAATPFPSIIHVGASGIITKVQVYLHQLQLSGDGNSWIILVRHPDGTTVLLWSDLANSSVLSTWALPLNILFDDSALSTIPPAPTNVTSGLWKPTNDLLQPTLIVPAPCPQPDYAFTLSALNGKLAAGAWSLWACSRLQAPVSILTGWSLNITTT